MGRLSIGAPVPLTADHRLADFDSGRATLDEWLTRRALKNQDSGATRSFVATLGERVVGYYALAAGSMEGSAATGRLRRNMPESIPVVVLARLAVDRIAQGQGIGRALFRDAARRTVIAAGEIGVRGLIVHALDQSALDFYLALGLTPSPTEPLTVMATIGDLEAAMSL